MMHADIRATLSHYIPRIIAQKFALITGEYYDYYMRIYIYLYNDAYYTRKYKFTLDIFYNLVRQNIFSQYQYTYDNSQYSSYCAYIYECDIFTITANSDFNLYFIYFKNYDLNYQISTKYIKLLKNNRRNHNRELFQLFQSHNRYRNIINTMRDSLLYARYCKN